MRVLAIDPGTHVGWAYVDTEEDPESFSGGEWGPYRAEPGAEYVAALKVVREYLDRGADVLVMEDFILLPPSVKGGWSSKREGLSPVRIIAMVEAIFRERDLFPEIEYQMSSAMSVITSERLKKRGFWVVGTEHGRDAAKHLAVYLRKKGL